MLLCEGKHGCGRKERALNISSLGEGWPSCGSHSWSSPGNAMARIQSHLGLRMGQGHNLDLGVLFNSLAKLHKRRADRGNTAAVGQKSQVLGDFQTLT